MTHLWISKLPVDYIPISVAVPIAVAIAARYKINHLPIVIISITYVCCACNMLQVESYNGLWKFILNGGNASNEIITEVISNLS